MYSAMATHASKKIYVLKTYMLDFLRSLVT